MSSPKRPGIAPVVKLPRMSEEQWLKLRAAAEQAGTTVGWLLLSAVVKKDPGERPVPRPAPTHSLDAATPAAVVPAATVRATKPSHPYAHLMVKPTKVATNEGLSERPEIDVEALFETSEE